MKALTWQGRRSVSVEEVPDPTIEEPNDAIIEVTSTAICGSEAGDLAVGDRVVIPFNISCGHCWMCERGLVAQCETTQVREHDSCAALFGYTELYGAVPGGQAELLRVPQAQFGPIKVPEEGPDERYLYLSDILPLSEAPEAYRMFQAKDDGCLKVVLQP